MPIVKANKMIFRDNIKIIESAIVKGLKLLIIYKEWYITILFINLS